MSVVVAKKTDKEAYNNFYKTEGRIGNVSSKEEFEKYFNKQITPFCNGGIIRGYTRRIGINYLLEAANKTGKEFREIVVLDAGCGTGSLSTFLALKGFNVVGVDISEEGCARCENLTKIVGVSDHCVFYPVSLDNIPMDDSSVDFIIGHGSFHHFIKYEGVPNEFYRVLKNGGMGFFTDPFAENKIYSVFHNKKNQMKLGDVLLNKRMIMNYYKKFDTQIIPTAWFVMIDKLLLKVLPSSAIPILRKISKFHFWLDRKIPVNSRIALYLSGNILTVIKK